jgi:hypothetical protein
VFIIISARNEKIKIAHLSVGDDKQNLCLKNLKSKRRKIVKRDCIDDIPYSKYRVEWVDCVSVIPVGRIKLEFEKMKLAYPVNEGWIFSKDKTSIKMFASYDKDDDMGNITFG